MEKSSHSPSLAEIQACMRRLITAPEGVAAALAHSTDTLPIKETAALSAVQRLEIYADMYVYRLLDSLREDFPALVQLLGDSAFHQFIADYLYAHPPGHYSLRFAGQHLPTFARTHHFAAQLPFLADLAQFDWLVLDAFDAADSALLEIDALQHVAPEHWPHLVLRTVPSLRLMHAPWEVHSMRQMLLREDSSAFVPQEGPTYVVVWRQGLQVVHRSTDALEYALLAQTQHAATFADLCEHALEHHGDTTATYIAQRIATWVQEGMLLDLQ